MKVILLVLAFCVAIAHGRANLPLMVQGMRMDFVAQKQNFSKVGSSTCDGDRYAHCVDCRTLSLCVGDIELSVRHCDRAAPFCVESALSADCSSDFALQSKECLPDVDNFMCTSVGYFPDPYFCQIYHICDETFGTSVSYLCPANYVFDGTTKHCILPASPSDCIIMQNNCAETKRVWSKYSANSEYFGFCPTNTILREGFDEIIMYKCDAGHEFDGESCVSDDDNGHVSLPPGTVPPGPVPPGSISCPYVGRFPVPNDPNRFVVCYLLQDGTMTYMIRNCSPNWVFNPEIQLCERP